MPGDAARLRRSPSSIRVGVPREFFFDDLEPVIAAATTQALSVIDHLTAGIPDVTLPGRASDLEAARGVVRAAEAYAYHRDWITQSPDRYQPETRERLRADAQVTTPSFIQALRHEMQARRAIDAVFATVDVLVTPTLKIAPHRLADFGPDMNTSMRLGALYARNTSLFNVYAIPSISVPCGFTRGGVPIGLQISGPKGGETVVFQAAGACERATRWVRHPPLD